LFDGRPYSKSVRTVSYNCVQLPAKERELRVLRKNHAELTEAQRRAEKTSRWLALRADGVRDTRNHKHSAKVPTH